jgi:NAD(P)-dependent dehydrogenase (short-subunit alcohol dehydrogenase family)
VLAERPLEKRVAVVTGVLGKLGPVWAKALSEAGATVVGIDVRPGATDGAAAIEESDVRDRDALHAVRTQVEETYGAVDVLVNNAGIDEPPRPGAGGRKLDDLSLEEFRETVDVNLAGTYVATQVFGSAMRKRRRGSIVNIGSLYASVAPDPTVYEHLGDPPFLKPPAYGASKAGIVNLTRYFARLWGPHGVRVNALSPGGVRGDQDEQFISKYCARVPLGRMAEPVDLVGPLVFLASDASCYVTGFELRVDGGFTA